MQVVVAFGVVCGKAKLLLGHPVFKISRNTGCTLLGGVPALIAPLIT